MTDLLNDDCQHSSTEYYYQIHHVAGEKRRHWLTFCKICGERTSHPWCKKPSMEIQATAKPFNCEAW